MYSTPAASICFRTSWIALSRPSWPMNASMSVVTDAPPLVKAARTRPPALRILGHRPYERPASRTAVGAPAHRLTQVIPSTAEGPRRPRVGWGEGPRLVRRPLLLPGIAAMEAGCSRRWRDVPETAAGSGRLDRLRQGDRRRRRDGEGHGFRGHRLP